MKQIKNTMISLVASEIFGKDNDFSVINSWTEDDFYELYKMSKYHSIANIVSSQLFHLKIDSKRVKILDRFKKEQVASLFSFNKFAFEAQSLYNILESEQIKFIPLKGAVVKSYYPEPYFRTSCDIDILINCEDCDKAVKCLTEGNGYKLMQGETLHDIGLWSPNGVHVELHYTLIEDDVLPKINDVLKDAWVTATADDGFRFKYSMSAEMFMYYHIAHMAKHFLNGGCGVRTYIDLWLLENKFKFDKKLLVKMLKATNLIKFYEISLELCKVWFADGKHNDLTKRVESFVVSGGVYGSPDNKMTVKKSKGESKLKIIFKEIFINKKNLQVIYPSLKKRPYLFCFYQIKRWFRIFDKAKRKKIKDITSATLMVNSDDSQELNKVLKELDLM